MTTDAPSVAMIYPSRPHDPTRDAKRDYGHPAHRGFARAIGATTVPLVRPKLPTGADSLLLSDLVSAIVTPVPDHDIYLLENDSVLYVAPRLAAEHPDAVILLLAASDRLVNDRGSHPATGDHQSTRQSHEILTDRQLLRAILKHYCDGVIAVSAFVADQIRPYTAPATPIGVVNPYVQPTVYERLRGIEPNLASTTAVTVSQWRNHKGIDLLVAAWPMVRERFPRAELRIVGPGHPRAYATTPGVTVCGFVQDIAAELSNASLYVHPARFEAFGVSVVEAMCAGVPPLVTETTGARVAVSQIDDSLVITPSPRALATAVNRYFATSLDRRSELSERSREASKPYTEAVQVPRFKKQFRSLPALIGRRRTAAHLGKGSTQAPTPTRTRSRNTSSRSRKP